MKKLDLVEYRGPRHISNNLESDCLFVINQGVGTAVCRKVSNQCLPYQAAKKEGDFFFRHEATATNNFVHPSFICTMNIIIHFLLS